MRCTDTTIAAGPSRLYGTFTLAGAGSGTTSNTAFTVSGASFHQANCAMTGSSCTETVASYSGSATVSDDGVTFEAPLYGSMLVALTGTVVYHEIRGQLGWHTYLGCCARQYYSGTFVARRLP